MGEKVPVGQCPNHGPVHGDDVNFTFPVPSTCARCEMKLKNVQLITQQKLEELTNEH